MDRYLYLTYVNYINKRIQGQLELVQRQYSTHATISIVVDKLAEHIRDSDWRPDLIVCWIDEDRHWNGSEEVARKLKDLLDIDVVTLEVNDRRQVTPESLARIERSEGRVLLVDDAAITGRTLNRLRRQISSRYPELEQRTGVLSVKAGVEVDYFGDKHETEDVLFPWGWARTTGYLYAYYNALSTHDRRHIPRSISPDGLLQSISIINNEDRATVTLIDALSPEAQPLLERTTHEDDLIYVVAGAVTIWVGDATGSFRKGEILYLPFVTPYQLTFDDPGTILLTISFRPSDKEFAARRVLPVEEEDF